MDRRIACETLADDGQKPPENEADLQEPEVPPDFPPESFWLSKDAEFDWFDRNAFFERKESHKGNSNSTNLNPGSNSNSQRFSKNLKSKATILGLPKPQKPVFVDAKNRKAGNARLFPKRSVSVGKSDGPMIEPSSPKVSCMGRVRSKRDRKRQLKKNRHRSHRSSEPELEKEKPIERRKKTGFIASFRAIFRTGCREKSAQTSTRHSEWSESPTHECARTVVRDMHAPHSDSLPRRSVEIDPPGLGGLHKFSSGRRSESWVGDVGASVA